MAPLLLASLVLLIATASADTCPPFSNAKSSCTSSTCGHFVFKGNFEDSSQHRLPVAANGIQLSAGTATPASCCNQCRQADGCAYWSLQVKTGLCVLYSKVLCEDAATGAGNDVYDPREVDSYVGGMCIQPAEAEASPVVAQDDVKLLDEKSFCLVTDTNLHINMLLGGYLDSRTSGAKSVRNGMTARTWIREMTFLWKADGKVHTLDLSARRGPEKERLDGYLDSIRVDGTAVPRLTLGDELILFDDHATLSFESFEKTGPYDVDVYKIRINGLVAELRLRIAHPLLQLEGDAEVHMNMDILDSEFSENVDGVLGQIFRADRLDQALNYAVLSDLMSASNTAGSAADSGGVMEGAASRYLSSSVTVPDCARSQFNKPAVTVSMATLAKEKVSAAAGGVKEAEQAEVEVVGEVAVKAAEEVLPEAARKVVIG